MSTNLGFFFKNYVTKNYLGKLKNVSDNVSTRYDLLLERNAFQDHPNTLFRRKSFNGRKKTNYLFLLELKWLRVDAIGVIIIGIY